jgi:hypothetical protein
MRFRRHESIAITRVRYGLQHYKLLDLNHGIFVADWLEYGIALCVAAKLYPADIPANYYNLGGMKRSAVVPVNVVEIAV